jgi:hypothetical protein
MMTMLNALLDLYKSSSSKTPLERFTTEIFCGVLRSDESLLNIFLQEFAGIEEKNANFKICTEKTYNNSRIDIVFKNDDYLIFLEAKVNSKENNGNQLETYASILKIQNKKSILLYCTKHPEPKDQSIYSPVRFKSFLWNDIYILLKNHSHFQNKTLVNYFLEYLEKQSMIRNTYFSIEDLAIIHRLPIIVKSLDDLMQQVKPLFIRYFKKINENNSLDNNLGQIYKNTRYGMVRHHLFKGDTKKSDYSSLYAHIEIDKNNPANTKVVLNLWIDRSHINYDLITQDLKNGKSYLPNFIENETEEEYEVIFEESMSNFQSMQHQFLAIEQWYEEKMSALHKYMTHYSQLEWDANKI